MNRLLFFIMVLAYIKGYSQGQSNENMLLDEFIVKNAYWCHKKLDNVQYIITHGGSLKAHVYLEGRKINLKLSNENAKHVNYNLICNGFVHPYNEPVGKEKVDSEYTYTKNLAPNESDIYTIGHRSLIPIIGHGGVPNHLNEEELNRAYLDMLYAGFDVSNSSTTIEQALRMLEHAKSKGIKLIIGHWREKESWYRNLANVTKDNKSSIYGFYIGDEPFLKPNAANHATIKELAPRTKAIRHEDPAANISICLNPIYGSEMYVYDDKGNHLGYDNHKYSAYIDSCITELGLTNIAFDNYSISTNDNGKRVIKRQWFDNLEIIRSQSLKHHIPFCGYVLSAQHLNYMMPTLGTMRLQMYANLAYGAKSIAYYTYWHRWLPGEGGYVAPIDSFGQRRSLLYDNLNRVNEEMARISPLFAEGTVKQVYHINGAPSNSLVTHMTPENLPKGIMALSIEDNKSAIASIITREKYTYLVIVNKDFLNPITLYIKGNKKLQYVSKLNLENKEIATDTYTIEAGDIIIFSLT